VIRAVKYIAAIAALPLLVSAIFGHPELNAWNAMSLLLILLSCFLCRYVASGRRGGGAKLLAIGLILFDLNSFNWAAPNKIDLAKARGVDEMDRLLSFRSASNFLKSRPGPFRVYPAMGLAPNFGDAYGIESTAGSGVTLLEHYAELHDHMDLLNAKYVLRPASASEPHPLWQDTNWKIYENPEAYPRAWIVHDTLVEHGYRNVTRALADAAIDLRHKALLSEPLAESLERESAQGADRVSLDHYNSTAPDVSVHTNGRGLLVLSEIYYPGWKATVNGRPTGIIEVDGGLRAVIVPAGDSRVSLRYRPASVLWGGIISLATVIAITISCFGLYGGIWRARSRS
jgi:hypothetical protein